MNSFEVEALNRRLAGAPPETILDEALHLHPEGLRFACSLGLEDMALLHLLRTARLPIKAFVLDTGRLHPETYGLLGLAQDRYAPLQVYFPETTAVEAYVNTEGLDAFRRSLELRKACCAIRKVEPLQRALHGASGWITGLRRDQSPTRTGLGAFELDWAHGGILKVNPLIDWTLEATWTYVKTHDVPVNPLHHAGFPSIGCAPCTRAIAPGEDPRAGRWWWEAPEQKECGLHKAVLGP
ncbi:MAG TPA: phosphoadenylyl-sulfate reductase [Holophagaceae bacterium]|nr:phosphoadenylyl-sulfate reductase [Holophagaceae bacterium]